MALPTKFLERIKQDLPEESALLEEALEQPAKISVRCNPYKEFEHGWKQSIPWCPKGFYLNERPVFTLDPLWHTGAYYPQEPSSMILDLLWETLVAPQEKMKVLDLCAAPGGKSTLLMSKLNKDSYLVSNEFVPARASILQENIVKWGTGNAFVTNNEAIHFKKLKHHFDLILVDAPCSGEGLFRKDEEAKEHWSSENCHLCEERQEKILQDVWDALKPDGYIFYSTCTFNKEENERLLLKVKGTLDFETIRIDFPSEWGITPVNAGTIQGYQFYPHRSGGEGFFIAVLKKSHQENLSNNKAWGQPKEIREKFVDEVLQESMRTILFRESIIALTEMMYDDFNKIDKQLNLKYAGTIVGTVLKGKLNPDHALAMSRFLKKEVFETIEIDRKQALKYLARQDFALDGKTLGWKLICYKHHPLGFIKHMGNRWNNYYPMSWRIRMDIGS